MIAHYGKFVGVLPGQYRSPGQVGLGLKAQKRGRENLSDGGRWSMVQDLWRSKSREAE